MKNYKVSAVNFGLISMLSSMFLTPLQGFADEVVADKVIDTSLSTNTKLQRGIGAAEVLISTGVGFKVMTPGKTHLDNLVIHRYRNASVKVMEKGRELAEAAMQNASERAASSAIKTEAESGVARKAAGSLLKATGKAVKVVSGPVKFAAGLPGAVIEVAGIYGVLGFISTMPLVALDGVGRVACGTSVLPRPIGNHGDACDIPFSKTSNYVPVKKEHHLALGGIAVIKGRRFVCKGDSNSVSEKWENNTTYLYPVAIGTQVEDEMVYCGTRKETVSQVEKQDSRVSQSNGQKASQGLPSETIIADSNGNGRAANIQ
jgi:hypothetical protein